VGLTAGILNQNKDTLEEYVEDMILMGEGEVLKLKALK
jgi:hypothetical protein